MGFESGYASVERMSFLAQLWREVSLHLELNTSVRRIAPMLAEHLPLRQIIVRRLDRDPLRLLTVANAFAEPQASAETAATRSECEPALQGELTRQLSVDRASLLAPGSSLWKAIVPQGLTGSVVTLPLTAAGRPLGVVLLQGAAEPGFSEEHVTIAQQLVEPLRVAFENDQRLNELARMREALEADRRALLSRLDRSDIADTVVGEAAGLRSVMERVEQVAPTDAPVLILGETGSGKEVIARAIHARARPGPRPRGRVNCGAIPANLIDSELFGHERGSFTGAVATRKGWFERADGGTLFLDEIGELPLEAQVRLLRVLQEGSLERVGGHQSISVDVRIVAATHRNLESMVAEGRFREDLWYRISIFPIRLPALRERPQDIPALAGHFARRAGLRLGGAALAPSEQDVQLLSAYAWPGNVRELIAVIERAAILGNGRRLEVAKALGTTDNHEPRASRPSTLPPMAQPDAPPPMAAAAARHAGDNELAPLDSAMISHIERALSATHGRIEGPFGAARVLGINPHTLRARMRKLGIEWSRFRQAKNPLAQH
jgi:transcriptional regulator with GAF, ATPase, and Fis domain